MVSERKLQKQIIYMKLNAANIPYDEVELWH